MRVSKATRRVYSEVDEFLKLLTDEQRKKIPKELKNMFRFEKDKEYIKIIDPTIDIEKQNLMSETLAIIAMLNLKYWCEDENEKEELKQIYINNNRFKKSFQKGFSFKTETEENKNPQKLEEGITIYKEAKIKRILNKILKFFHLK